MRRRKGQGGERGGGGRVVINAYAYIRLRRIGFRESDHGSPIRWT